MVSGISHLGTGTKKRINCGPQMKKESFEGSLLTESTTRFQI